MWEVWVIWAGVAVLLAVLTVIAPTPVAQGLFGPILLRLWVVLGLPPLILYSIFK